MSDFFSFEFFDEPPGISDSFEDQGSSSRRNLSLNASGSEYLRDAVQRLVPSSYMYGGSGLGERAYELYGLCVSHALTGKRSNRLLAALCIMHASYEKRSDLVILPTDIERKYANLKMSQLRLSNILSVYDDFCRLLGLERLEVSMNKLLYRVFKQGCRMEDESDVFKFIDTALRFEKEIRAVTEYSPPKPTKRVNYRQKFRIETVAAVCAILAIRFHDYTKATAKSIEAELNVSKGSVHYLLNKYKATTPAPGKPESQRSPKKRRTEPIYISGLDVRAGVSRRHKDAGTLKTETEEVLAIVPSHVELTNYHEAPDANDPLSFLYDLGDLITTNPGPTASAIRQEESAILPLPDEEKTHSSRASSWCDIL
jgi:hypothetical protein